jgi:hypothetical protein
MEGSISHAGNIDQARALAADALSHDDLSALTTRPAMLGQSSSKSSAIADFPHIKD